LIRRIVFLCLASLFVSSAAAQDRTAKIRALMEAQGQLQTMQQMLTASRAQGRATANKMMEQALDGLAPDPATKEQLSQAAHQFIEEIQSPVSAEQIVDIWADAYGSKFSDSELDGLLAYYRSPLAQKEVQVAREAILQMSARVQEIHRPVMQAAITRYVERIRKIVGECNCARQ
jgi:hypothetical protein